LHVESNPGSGSCFSLSLKRTSASLPVNDAFNMTSAESGTGSKSPSSLAL
jgi:hypothetical protein